MTDTLAPDPPSPFLARWIPRCGIVAPSGARALDVASGKGRHLALLLAAGYRTTIIDNQIDVLRTAIVRAHESTSKATALCADLTQFPLPRSHYHLVVVCRYLDRALFPALRETLVPGGVLLYETFTERQLQYARGPRSRAHLLTPGELRMFVRGMDVLFDEEVSGPDAIACIAAMKGG